MGNQANGLKDDIFDEHRIQGVFPDVRHLVVPFLILQEAFLGDQMLELSALVHLDKHQFFDLLHVRIQELLQSHIQWLEDFNDYQTILARLSGGVHALLILLADVLLEDVSIHPVRHEKDLRFRIDDIVAGEILGEFLLDEGLEFFESLIHLLLLDRRILVRSTVFIMLVGGGDEFAVLHPWQGDRRNSISSQVISFVSFGSCRLQFPSLDRFSDQFAGIDGKIGFGILLIDQDDDRMLVLVGSVHRFAHQRIAVLVGRRG